MRLTHLYIICSLFSISLKAQFYIPVFTDLDGEDLTDHVIQSYKPAAVLDYGEARDLMYAVIYNEQDSVKGIYSDHTLYLPPNVDPSSFLYMNGASNGINTEHTYPRSKGADSDNGNAFSDMHHLFPTRAGVNLARSNYPFAEIPDTETKTWYYKDEVISSPPTSNIDLYSERKTGQFEPREQQKGNVARAMFYFFTMYNQEALAADPTYFELQRETLCNWHYLDPVDSLEWNRTFLIADQQDDKANPFILDSTLAKRIYCQDVPILNATIPAKEPTEVLIYPNPVIDQLFIKAKGHNTLKVLDVLGRIILQNSFYNNTKIDFSPFQKGHYFIWIKGQVYKAVKI